MSIHRRTRVKYSSSLRNTREVLKWPTILDKNLPRNRTPREKPPGYVGSLVKNRGSTALPREKGRKVQYTPGNDHISHLAKRKIIDKKKVPSIVGDMIC